jgi:hypothetical protein
MKENILKWRAWIDYDSLPWHIILRDWEGGGYILKDKNEWISEEYPDWDYYTFDEAQEFASEWYHVPSKEEWEGVYKLGIEKWWWKEGDWDIFSSKLKLPATGRRRRSSFYGQGKFGFYWSNMMNISYVRVLCFHSSSVYPNSWNFRDNGFSVRLFKNL